MQYNFTPDVRKALSQARDAALQLRHDFVAPHHILIALLQNPQIIELLESEARTQRLRTALSHMVAAGRRSMVAGDLPYSARAKRSLEYAMKDARDRDQRDVDSRNLLVGVLRADDRTAEVAREHGLTLESLDAPAAPSRGPTSKGHAVSSEDSVWYLKVDASSETPIYEQIVQRIEEAVAIGRLVTGERLPAVRELAAELEIAPGTVARAYAGLEERGVVITEGARGTRVAARARTRNGDPERESTLEGLLRPVVVAAYHLGAKAQELRDALERAMKGILNGGARPQT